MGSSEDDRALDAALRLGDALADAGIAIDVRTNGGSRVVINLNSYYANEFAAALEKTQEELRKARLDRPHV